MADYKITKNAEHSLVICSILGRIDLSEALRIGGAARWAASEEKANLLYDLRQAEVAVTMAEFFDLARELDAAGIPRVRRVSILAAEAPSSLNFYETTASNVGHQVQVFDDEEAAYAFAIGNSAT